MSNISLVMVNDQISTLNEAKIPFSDRGFLFGHAVFETLLVVGGNIVEWDSHYNRLMNACSTAAIISPESKKIFEDCKKLINQIQENQHCSLKILVTGGNHSELSLPADRTQWPEANIYIVCTIVSSMSLEKRMKGFALKTFLDARGSFLVGIKTTSYLFSFLCLAGAKEAGLDDALLLNENGDYTEGVTSSFLWFELEKSAEKPYRVYSTIPQGNCLAGTSILKLEHRLKESGIPFEYSVLNKNRATNCAGCALISSVRGIVPIRSIDSLHFDIEPHAAFFKFLIELMNS